MTHHCAFTTRRIQDLKPHPAEAETTFNLTTEPWLPVRRRSGAHDMITPAQINEGEDPIVDFAWPRPDFNAASYEWYIALLTTACAPHDESAWDAWWEAPPREDVLSAQFTGIAYAFNLDGDGARFAQDLDPLENGKTELIETVLVDGPREQTEKFNAELFRPDTPIETFGPGAAAIALYTLQTTAPMGGGGHRTSLRGGGPLSTLIAAAHPTRGDTLWGRIWPNVETKIQIEARAHAAGAHQCEQNPFPWTRATRVSRGEGSTTTAANEVHPLELYWAMPRRIRLCFSKGASAHAHCGLTATATEQIVRTMRTLPGGTNYVTESFRHPLTPYRRTSETTTRPVLARSGLNTYRLWPIGITTGSAKEYIAAQAVRTWREGRAPQGTRTRCAFYGYEVRNMQVVDWIEGEIPIEHHNDTIEPWIEALAERTCAAADRIARWLREAMAQAHPGAKATKPGELTPISETFFNETGNTFYRELSRCAQRIESVGNAPVCVGESAQAWLKFAAENARELFDEAAPIGANIHAGTPWKVDARNRLFRALAGWGEEGRALLENDLEIAAPTTRTERDHKTKETLIT